MDKHAKHPAAAATHAAKPARDVSGSAPAGPSAATGLAAPSSDNQAATWSATPLSLEQELEHLTRLLHAAHSPRGDLEQEVLMNLARHLQSLVDTRTCALRSEAFVCHLETEMHRVRRGKSDLALVCFSLHGQDDIVSQHGPDAVHLACQALVHSLREYVLPCDCIGHIPSGHHALLLPGINSFKAQVYIEKVLKDCASQGLRTAHGAFIPHFMAGIACASATSAQAHVLLQEALEALQNAACSTTFCAVYRNTGSTGLYQTLVHSKEKRFLFSGGL